MKARRSFAATEPDLSAWTSEQTRLIKEALRAYRGRIVEGRASLSWLGIQNDIKDVTGVDMGGKDTLRQFVEGDRAAPVAERRKAIVEFLTHPEVDAISLSELLIPDSPYHAAKRLLEYLKSDFDPVGIDSPLHCLIGSYTAEHEQSKRLNRISLHLSKFDDDKILIVKEKSEIFNYSAEASYRQDKPRYETAAQSRKESTGWCILTPEDNVLFFMKENQYGSNHYYHLLTDVNIWTLEPPKRFVLMRCKHPHQANQDIKDNQQFSYQVFMNTRNNAISFNKNE